MRIRSASTLTAGELKPHARKVVSGVARSVCVTGFSPAKPLLRTFIDKDGRSRPRSAGINEGHVPLISTSKPSALGRRRSSIDRPGTPANSGVQRSLVNAWKLDDRTCLALEEGTESNDHLLPSYALVQEQNVSGGKLGEPSSSWGLSACVPGKSRHKEDGSNILCVKSTGQGSLRQEKTGTRGMQVEGGAEGCRAPTSHLRSSNSRTSRFRCLATIPAVASLAEQPTSRLGLQGDKRAFAGRSRCGALGFTPACIVRHSSHTSKASAATSTTSTSVKESAHPLCKGTAPVHWNTPAAVQDDGPHTGTGTFAEVPAEHGPDSTAMAASYSTLCAAIDWESCRGSSAGGEQVQVALHDAQLLTAEASKEVHGTPSRRHPRCASTKVFAPYETVTARRKGMGTALGLLLLRESHAFLDLLGTEDEWCAVLSLSGSESSDGVADQNEDVRGRGLGRLAFGDSAHHNRWISRR
jgi:hypothetical protein